MLASLHLGQLPGMPAPPWRPRQEITFGELETEAGRLMRGCVVPVSRARGKPKTGWVAVGEFIGRLPLVPTLLLILLLFYLFFIFFLLAFRAVSWWSCCFFFLNGAPLLVALVLH